MAEYWKSTPKYWCKFCQVFVRDTKIERQNHDATGRHQSAIQRSLRDIHRTREREDREKQRAKDEVARLNGLTGAGAGGASSSSSASATTATRAGKAAQPQPSARAAPSQQATAEERKRQLKQLADMGVAVPDAFRGEMALAGEWQTVAVTPVDGDAASSSEYRDANRGAGGALLNVGVRKRKAEDGEEEEEEEAEALRALSRGEKKPARKAGWGNSFKAFPGAKGGDPGDDIEALLGGAKKVKTEVKAEEGEGEAAGESGVKKEEEQEEDGDGIKKEARGDGEGGEADPVGAEPKLADIPPVKAEDDEGEKEGAGAAAGGVVFKKRKGKAMRQK
ncbi:u1 zinc finger domain-containing protein [Diplodia corticola]|uniref:U1 zinc finger domain-containing protein n=1 Tax=Diplodia corticola TaxID=236234 RepID=A0A1J9RAJ7_9PEZI|nr:u1 zinc finger domain-containing protein [Diplodia corticola]OJD38622.1 u1 zinc finger domain-containing protein [Diplodia corticola]